MNASIKEENTIIDEPQIDESQIDESQVDEPQIDESLIDESLIDESQIDESQIDESLIDEPQVDESEPPITLKIKPISRKKRKEKDADIYLNTIITRVVYISITNIGKNLETTLKQIISDQIEGRCIVEGYIKPGSISVISYSNGVQNGYNIVFEVVVECSVCNPVEGMHIMCFAKNITKAGIRAEVSQQENPIVIFISRDHNYQSKLFAEVVEGQEIKIRVIGQRFELNDKYISVIGELIKG